MKTIINIKTDKEVKEQAVQTAQDMGVPLSTIVNALIKKFIYDRSVTIVAPLRPSKQLERRLNRIDKDIKAGKNLSPVFTDMKEMDRYIANL